MKDKSIKQLLELVKQEFNDTSNRLNDRKIWHGDGYNYMGLCNILHLFKDNNIINTTEHIALKDYFYDNRPRCTRQYYTNDGKRTGSSSQFWYKPFNKSSRNRWLNKHIKLNTN